LAYEYFLRLGCLDLASPQAIYYARNAPECGLSPWTVHDVCGCPGLDVATGYPDGWTDPTTDDAPWYDTTEPQSPFFGGLIIHSVAGLGPGKMTRKVTTTTVDGAVLGRRKQTAPVITVTGTLVGGSCCAVAYGLRWLRQALEGECDQPGCPGQDLVYLECCPSIPEGATDAEIEALFAEQYRTIKGVALVDSPEIVNTQGRSCGCGACPVTTVQFTLSGQQPCVFREPKTIVDNAVIMDGATLVENCFTWIKVADGEVCDDADCPDPEPCSTSSACPPPPAPPPPPIIIDTCLTCTPFEQYQRCVDVAPTDVPAWAKGALTYRVNSGGRFLRHVTLKLYENLFDLPPDELDPCSACTEVNVSFIPAASTLVIDGEARTVTLECPGGVVEDASHLVAGAPGKTFTWPEVECGGQQYAMCISVDASEPVSPTASFDVLVTAKEC
jgi:hypothetical protein